MAKTYKPATERQIKKGKGVSTDELSFGEALKYFQARGKERDMNRFRHKGKVYDLTGKEIAPKATPKALKPKEKPVTKDAMTGYRKGDITTTSLDKPKTKPRTGPTKTEKMRGDARTSAQSQTSINNTKKKIRDIQGQLDKNSAVLAAASLGSGVLTRGNTSAKGKPFNPTYGSQKPQATGFQGKMNTTVGRPARVGGAKGISGTNPARLAKQIGRGGRKNTPQDSKDFNPFLN